MRNGIWKPGLVGAIAICNLLALAIVWLLLDRVLPQWPFSEPRTPVRMVLEVVWLVLFLPLFLVGAFLWQFMSNGRDQTITLIILAAPNAYLWAWLMVSAMKAVVLWWPAHGAGHRKEE